MGKGDMGISSRLSISRPLAVESMVETIAIGIGVSMVGTVEGGDYRDIGMVTIGNSNMGLGIGISRPLAIVVSMPIAMVETICMSNVSIRMSSMAIAISQMVPISIAMAIVGVSVSI